VAEQIKEGAAPVTEPEVVEEQPVAAEPEVAQQEEAVQQEGEAPAAEAQPEGDAAEVAPVEGEAESTPEAAPQQQAAPAIPKEIADAVANWQTWQAILERNPALKAQAQAEYQRMANPPQQAQQEPELLDDVALRQEYNQLVEQGKHYEANQLLVRHDPEVRRAKMTVQQIEKAEHAKNVAAATQEIAEHTKVYGPLDREVRAEMTEMYGRGYKGNLVSARVAALTKLGKLKEASALLTKAANSPQPRQVSSSAGGRVPAGKGAPAPRRVAKSAPTPGSGITPEDVSYIEKRERERGGYL
jgi:hypothetical protein